MTNKEKTFEDKLGKLEDIVAKLESGKLSLEESLEKFEEGVALYKDCKVVLDKVEKKITLLTKDLKEKTFDENED